MTKACIRCGETKPLEAFAPNRESRDGHRHHCRDCQRTYMREYMRRRRAANPEAELEAQRRWRKNNPEAGLAKDRRYKERHRDLLRERNLQWRKDNPARARESYQRWRTAHREQELLRLATRRALTNSDDPELRALVADLLARPCTYCGSTEQITVDHVVPLSRGGKHEASNLAPACLPCNSSKNNRLLSEWAGPPSLRKAA